MVMIMSKGSESRVSDYEAYRNSPIWGKFTPDKELSGKKVVRKGSGKREEVKTEKGERKFKSLLPKEAKGLQRQVVSVRINRRADEK